MGQLAELDYQIGCASFLFTDFESSYGTDPSRADSRLEQRKTRAAKEEETPPEREKAKTAFRKKKKGKMN